MDSYFNTLCDDDGNINFSDCFEDNEEFSDTKESLNDYDKFNAVLKYFKMVIKAKKSENF